MQMPKASESSLYKCYSVRPKGARGKAVAYLDMQISVENRKHR